MLVLYELFKCILDCIVDVELVLGEDRVMVLVKEIMKIFEIVRMGMG